MEANHKTSNPVVLATGAACIFVFTSIVFIFYDTLVARRQRIVMNRALQSGAIVRRRRLFVDREAQSRVEQSHSFSIPHA